MLCKSHWREGWNHFSGRIYQQLWLVGKVKGNVRLSSQIEVCLGWGGREPGCFFMGARAETQWSHTVVCRDTTFFGDLSSFINAWKNNFWVKCTLFCHFLLVERNHSWCSSKWQNHYRSVMKNASDFLALSRCLLSAAELCTFQIFCRINLMDQGSEMWMGLGYFCRQLNLSEVWALCTGQAAVPKNAEQMLFAWK